MRPWLVMLCTCSLAFCAEEAAVRRVLEDQATAWNRGDVRGFMTGYDRSPETTFVSDKVTHGWDAVLARYLARYGSRDKMGHLTFSELEIRMLGAKHAAVVGRFALARSAEAGGDVGGLFTLVLERKKDGWKIVLDHTTTVAQPLVAAAPAIVPAPGGSSMGK